VTINLSSPIQMVMHLADLENGREAETLHRLLGQDKHPLFRSGDEGLLGLQTREALIGLMIPFRCLFGSLPIPGRKDGQGDVDVLVAPWSLHVPTYMTTPLQVDLSTIVAAEIKTLPYSRERKLTGKGLSVVSREGREAVMASGSLTARFQAKLLAGLGFDRATLLHIVVAQAHESRCVGIQSWLYAGDAAGAGTHAASPRVYTELSDPFSTIVAAIGAVPDREEDLSGSYDTPVVMHDAGWISGAAECPYRRSLNQALQTALDEEYERRHERTWHHRPLLLACSNTACSALFITTQGPSTTCRRCGALTTLQAERPQNQRARKRKLVQ
jgi:hypothetical protein